MVVVEKNNYICHATMRPADKNSQTTSAHFVPNVKPRQLKSKKLPDRLKS